MLGRCRAKPLRVMTSEIAPDDKPRIAADAFAEVSAAGRASPESPAMPDAVRQAEAAAPARISHAEVRAIFFGIMLAMFLSALEQTIVAPALPAIGKSLGSIDDLSWVVTAYLLAATATTPLFGKLSDIYGRRMVMLSAISFFVLGSIACAMAPSIWVLIAARALQGIGGGGLLPIAQTVIADMLSPARAADHPGLYVDHVHDREHARAGARRPAHRSFPLVADLLDQCAARPDRAGDHRPGAAQIAAARSAAPARRARRRVDGRRSAVADDRARLGRHVVSVGLMARRRRSLPRPPCCGAFLCCGFSPRASRSFR